MCDSKKSKSNQKWNKNKSSCECKNPEEHSVSEKGYFWNPATCSSENGKYVGNIIGDSIVIWEEIIDTAQPIPTKSTSRKTVPRKGTLRIFYILLTFLLVAIALLTALIIYLIKNWSKRKYFILYHAISKW